MKILSDQEKKYTLQKSLQIKRTKTGKTKIEEWQSEVKHGRKGNHEHLQVTKASTKMPLPLS